MILSSEIMGDSYQMILDDRITKEEAKMFIEGDSSKFKKLNLTFKPLIGKKLLEDVNGYMIEDSDGMIHVMSIGSIVRLGLSDIIKELPEIEFNNKEDSEENK